MDDTRCREFFAQPINPYHRRFEALRAVFHEGRSQRDVADEFGFRYSSLRQMVYEFRQHCRRLADASPFFASRPLGGLLPRGPRHCHGGPLRRRSRKWQIVGSWSSP